MAFRYTPTPTPSVSPTISLTPSNTPSYTPTGTVCPGLTPTATTTPPITQTITPSPTGTIQATPTYTPTNTNTPTISYTCREYRIENNTESSIAISYYDCDGNYQSDPNLGSGQQITFCANQSYGLIDYSSGTLFDEGLCPDKSLELRVLDIASTPQTITMFYSINGGSNINIPGGTSVIFPITCTLLYTISGLTSADIVVFGTSISCAMEGAGGTSCPGFVGSLTTYSYVVDAPTVQTLSLTIDTQTIP